MSRKSISPLIATFILISLTVAVGAMIVAWGRDYVQRQTRCLEVDLRILEVDYNTTTKTINAVRILYNGMQPIPANERLIFIAESRNKRTVSRAHTLSNSLESNIYTQINLGLSIESIANEPPINLYVYWTRCPDIMSTPFVILNP